MWWLKDIIKLLSPEGKNNLYKTNVLEMLEKSLIDDIQYHLSME